jgi:hypothetical protein
MVALADVYADLAEDVVRGCRMEADLRHCEVIQIALRLHRARLATHPISTPISVAPRSPATVPRGRIEMIRQNAPLCAIGESPTKAYSFFPSSTLSGFSNLPLRHLSRSLIRAGSSVLEIAPLIAVMVFGFARVGAAKLTGLARLLQVVLRLDCHPPARDG